LNPKQGDKYMKTRMLTTMAGGLAIFLMLGTPSLLKPSIRGSGGNRGEFGAAIEVAT
jgi:hypothetical protein